MNVQRKIYQIGAYLKHLFTSWNTGGEGIHSPYLFYLVRMLVYDDNRYYSWREIEEARRNLLRSDETIEVIDFGTGGKQSGGKDLRRVRDIARNSLEQARVGEILFRLVNYLGHVQQRPLRVVELGTSLGITTAYLAKADSRNHVTTFEGSPEIARIARQVWQKLHIDNVQQVLGNIDDTLYKVRDACARNNIDIAYIDANHTCEATLRYYDYLSEQAGECSIFVLDDIHYSPEMAQAWRKICAKPEVTTTMDFYHFGLVFFDKHYLRRNYKLRL